jgi:2-dehydro-3-deoxy-D-gluconate 5-dehydrogenase
VGPREQLTNVDMNSFRLDGKVALVTGASRGLGAAIAVALADAGAGLVLHASRQPATATECVIRERTGQPAALVVGDLADRRVSDRLVSDAITALGRLDILINNAGTVRRAPAVDFSDDDWDAIVEVNLTSAFRLCRAAGRHMLERGSGKIVNVASLLSFQGGITVPAYAAAKGGLAQLTKALANEWAGRGVNVNAIAPGYMRTDNTQALQNDAVRSKQILDRIPAGRWGEPADLEGAVVFLASPASNYVHGHVLVVDGGWMGR